MLWLRSYQRMPLSNKTNADMDILMIFYKYKKTLNAHSYLSDINRQHDNKLKTKSLPVFENQTSENYLKTYFCCKRIYVSKYG